MSNPPPKTRRRRQDDIRRLPYVLLDVFTTEPLAGNQLAVFTDAGELTDAQMQGLAKEMNLSETTFILRRMPADERQKGYRVRIFTVGEELPFAGHPTLGTAYVLRGGHDEHVIELELNVGKIPVAFSKAENGFAFGEMTQRDPEFGQTHTREELARAMGLPLADLAEDLPIQTVNTGVPFAIVPLKSLEAARRLAVDWRKMEAYGEKTDAKFLYFVTRETVDPEARVHARMIFYNGEDPATGSAAGCCAAWMVRHGVAKSEERVVIEQGIEIARPSQMHVTARREGDKVVNVRVGGFCVEIGRGEVLL